jgi:hypothetical protein
MKPVPTDLIKCFADAFCFGKKGLSAAEIPQFFSAYEGAVPTAASYDMGVAKSVLFADCVRALSPENQRLALYDLCDSPPSSRHAMPNGEIRRGLLATLVQADGRSPIGIELSTITAYGIREHWFTAASRIPLSPAGAITAARALVESTCKTILVECGKTPDCSGDLARLYKQTREALGLDPRQGATQDVHRLSGGLTQIVDGLAGLSNKAGDRHGLPSGSKIADISYASLAVHAAGTASLFLVRVHKDIQRGPPTFLPGQQGPTDRSRRGPGVSLD